MRKRNVVALVAVAAEAYGALTYLGLTWGATRQERRRSLPGDDIVPDPMLQTDHAITIGVPPSDVWPWLVQMGWGRAGWYTYRWVDKLIFPKNGPSADAILPEHQHLAVGDRIPDGAPEAECFFTVEALVPNKQLVLLSHTHLPPRPRTACMDWTWTYALTAMSDGRTRLQTRTRLRMEPRWLALVYRALIGADFIMGRSHLLGIKRRAESPHAVAHESSRIAVQEGHAMSVGH